MRPLTGLAPIHGSDYVTGENNQLNSDGVYTYTYDDQGNMKTQMAIATGIVEEFEWDYRNRLTSIITRDATGAIAQQVNYIYDVMGRRIAKTVDADGAGGEDAITTHFVYDRDNVSLEFVGQNATPTQRYFYGPQVDQVLAQEDNSGQTLWLLSDHLGTVKDLVDDTGNVLNHRTYDSYGNLITQTNAEVSSRYGFTGRELDDETGLYYYRARYYNSEIGQFISQDPIGFRGGDNNLYRYVVNSPLMGTDPSGLITIVIPGGGSEFGDLLNNLRAVAVYPVFGVPNPGASGDDTFNMLQRSQALGAFVSGVFSTLGITSNEPVNIVAHSDGNGLIAPLVQVIRKARGISMNNGIVDGIGNIVACRSTEKGKLTINVARLDPLATPRRVIYNAGADRVIDFFSSVNTGDPRDATGRVGTFLNRPSRDVVAVPTGHMGLLDSQDVVNKMRSEGFNL